MVEGNLSGLGSIATCSALCDGVDFAGVQACIHAGIQTKASPGLVRARARESMGWVRARVSACSRRA